MSQPEQPTDITAPIADAIAVSVSPSVDGQTSDGQDILSADGQDILSAPQPRVGELLLRAGQGGGSRFISDRRLFLSQSGSVVEAGDADARYVLVGPGGDLPQDLAGELGLKHLA